MVAALNQTLGHRIPRHAGGDVTFLSDDSIAF